MIFDREMETQTLISHAVDGFIKELGLKETDKHLIEGQIEFRDAEPGITLLRENCSDVSFFKAKFIEFTLKFNNF